ncbi:hypothetical protein PoHVEF18_010280 [Penicillium ochrochloron]
MQFTSAITFLISFALFFQGIEALARSKLDQYTSETCDGKFGDGDKYRTQRDINIKSGRCIDINSSTESIWLGRGTGLAWRRKMTAYSETGCPSNKRIDFLDEKSGYYTTKSGVRVPHGNCIPVDYMFVGSQGVDQKYQGRLMSVKFDDY